jgi:predicted porin
LGASYNFGFAKLMADAVRDARSGGATGKGWMVATVVPIGPHEIHASYSTYKLDTGASPGASKYAIAYQHNLSKRTALYATYAHLKNKRGSSQALNGAAASPDSTSNGFDLGIRHFF